MRWFRFRRGVVQESLRVAHRVESVESDGMVRSWCRLMFQPVQIEEITDPSAPVIAGPSPCSVCELRLETSRDGIHEVRNSAPAHRDGSLVMILRKAQWLLDDAAFYLPKGQCSSDDCELLATTLEQLATLVRERAARCVTIDLSAE